MSGRSWVPSRFLAPFKAGRPCVQLFESGEDTMVVKVRFWLLFDRREIEVYESLGRASEPGFLRLLGHEETGDHQTRIMLTPLLRQMNKWTKVHALAALDRLRVLHSHGFLHGDVRPANFMETTGGELILIDFGLALKMDGQGGCDSLVQGDPAYASWALLSDWMNFFHHFCIADDLEALVHVVFASIQRPTCAPPRYTQLTDIETIQTHWRSIDSTGFFECQAAAESGDYDLLQTAMEQWLEVCVSLYSKFRSALR
ncbi:hypothetical protein PAPYR_4623 [Paratrimastix pyriformis]|uniref:Protein kinase domain-containing protein n=1 Tax=Paratrimastix pyriformis TaxID=342808 RepID=A0ABQ8UMV3_9EUKA|nr:hypothetical protein PAPYR_4623 [Paratrimastix pyriformis]